MATILDHIDAALRAKKMKDATASRLAAGNASLIKNIRAGRGNVGFESLQRLAQVLDLEIYFGPAREPVGVEHITVEGSDYARIPVHDARLSAGPGETNEGVAIIDHLAFRQDWLRKIDVKPENALMARIEGDSMAPAIQSGDLVMIDKTRLDVPAFKKTRLPQQLPIFAFRQDDQARVKRLERRPEEKLLVLYSDNPTVLPEILAEGDVHTLNILGQVVWSGHVWR